MMHVVEVIPIAKGVHRETLSYFTSKDVSPGCLVTIPLRGKSVPALVTSVKKVALSKGDIKASPFKLRRVDSIKTHKFISPNFMKAAEKTAQYFASGIGGVLRTLIPKALDDWTPKTHGEDSANSSLGIKTVKEKLLVQADEEERFSTYKSIIREEFAQKRSVFLCLPEIFEVEKYVKLIEKGIQEYTFVLHSGLQTKEIISRWNKILGEKHPVLIIGTGLFMSIQRKDLGTIILDRESSQSYKTLTRPFIDIRKFSEFLAEETGVRLIFGDMALRAETIFRKEKGEFAEFSPLKFRSLGTAASKVIDMKKSDGEYRVIHDEIKSLIGGSKEKSEHLFALVNRRGALSLTACSDCGNIQSCDRCQAPLVLHKKNGSNSFICHKCGNKYEAKDRCSVCRGSRFKMLGIGIEQVIGEIEKLFPDIKIFRLDSDTAKTHKKCSQIVEKFYSSPGSVLVGTAKAIVYLDKKIENIAIVAVDGMLAIPDFRMNERIFNMLLRLRAKASKNFFIQTRKSDNKIFEYASKGDLVNFYREEIAERQFLGYPPINLLIKISLRGKINIIKKEVESLAEMFKEWSPETFPAFIPIIKGLHRANILLKLPYEKWIDRKLLDILLSLPPQVEVRVDPEDIL